MFVRYYVEIPSPFEEVEGALLRSPAGWLPGLVRTADQNGQTLLAEVGFASPGGRLSKRVEVRIGDPIHLRSKTVLPISWRAKGLQRLFPVMDADIEVAPLGQTRTQLSMSARYQAPLGAFGEAADRALLHRVAEATVKDFVERAARALERRISAEARRGGPGAGAASAGAIDRTRPARG